MEANTALILQVKMKKVKRAKPQTTRYMAMTALKAGDASPVGSSAVAYGAPSCSVGSCSMPKEPQKTANRPITIIGKKLPMIHSKTMAKMSSTGPTKKKMPLDGQPTPRLSVWWFVDHLHHRREPLRAAPSHANYGEGKGRDDEAARC
jgi:hypothetical protein